MRASRLRPITLVLLGGCLPFATLAAEPAPAPPPSETKPVPRFDIKGYTVEGQPQLSKAEIDAALAWLPGAKRSMSELQKAQQALQAAYHRKGMGSVYVLLPEQEVVDGIVRFSVVQGKVGKVTLKGNQHFSEANVRRALVTLKQGQPLDATRLSENIQLANENPARQLEVALGVERGVGDIDAKVTVADERPLRVFATVDNTGNDATGRHRVGVAAQHANLFDRDHTGSLAYTTSPDAPSGANVHIYSLGYRVPIYPRDSLELVYGHSSVDIPTGSPALGGVLGMVGKGDVLNLRWNHYLPQQGEYSARVALGLDHQDIGQDCSGLSGAAVAGCVGYRTMPLQLAYIGRWNPPSRSIGFDLALRANVGGSSTATLTQASGREVSEDFKLLRGSATLTQALPAEWLLRLGAQLQLTDEALPSSEQIGLAGSSAVRGYEERAQATDQGLVLQTEVYTPKLKLPLPGELRLLAFYDYAYGNNYRVPSGSRDSFMVSSAGLGLRYQYQKNVFWRADFAKPLHSDAKPTGARVHFSVTVGY